MAATAFLEPRLSPSDPAAALRPRRLTSLADLESDMCRFPYEWTAEDPSPDSLSYGYGGAKVADDLCPWCAGHFRLVTA